MVGLGQVDLGGNHLQLMVGPDHKNLSLPFGENEKKKIEVKEVEESKERLISL
jgi:hypothetical protein